MDIAIIGSGHSEAASRALEEAPDISVGELRCYPSAEDAARELTDGSTPALAVIECTGPDGIAAIQTLRAEVIDVAILAVVGPEPGEIELACEAGADDAITVADFGGSRLARAVRYATVQRASQLSEHRLLETTRGLAESLATEDDLDTVATLLLGEIRAHTGAEAGFLAFEWSWNDLSDHTLAVSGAEGDESALLRDPELAELFTGDGITAVELGADRPFGPLASALSVPIADGSSWGRGAIVVASPRERAFSERELKTARAIAALAGVAILNTSIRRERNRAVEVRENVLAVASHDLRTPLSVLNMSVELLAETDDADERQSLARRAERSIENMRRLIGDLLDYAAVDAGSLRIERARVKAGAIARQTVAAFKPSADEGEIELVLDVEGEPVIFADAGRVEQALANIVANAIKFTPAGGRVEVSVAARKRSVVFSVSDTGSGIPDEMQRRLFDRYQSSSKGRSGVGLGLSIARGIVAAHGGSVLLESTVGEGSTFLLTFPIEG